MVGTYAQVHKIDLNACGSYLHALRKLDFLCSMTHPSDPVASWLVPPRCPFIYKTSWG